MTSISLRYRAAPSAERERARAKGLKRFYLTICGYGGLCVLLIGGAWWGVTPVGPVVAVVGLCVALHAVFFALLYSGRLAAREEPTGAFEHLLAGLGLLTVGYALIPEVRSTTLQVFFVMVAFDASRLSRPQFSVISMVAVGGVIAAALKALYWDDRVAATDNELLDFAMAAMYLPILALIGTTLHGARSRQRRQKAALTVALEQLQTLSERDALTGAVNRRHAMVLLEREQLRQQRTAQPFSICMLDVDFFKQVNDTYGHPVGDQALIRLVALARDTLGEPHLVARWGGEEFLVLMFDTPAAGAVAAMERLRQALARQDASADAIGLRIDISVGVCEHRPGDALQLTLEHADRALYAAKQQGRGRVVEHGR